MEAMTVRKTWGRKPSKKVFSVLLFLVISGLTLIVSCIQDESAVPVESITVVPEDSSIAESVESIAIVLEESIVAVPEVPMTVIPEELVLNLSEHPWGLYPEYFYPLGFSPAGHFAYCTYLNETDGIGAITRFHFVIQDLRSDEVVERITYRDDPDSAESYEEYRPVPFSALWENNLSDIQGAMDRYGVVRQSLALSPLPLELDDGESLGFNVMVSRSDEGMIFYNDQLSVTAWRGNRSKRVLHRTQNRSLDAVPQGVFLSPYENRAALVLVEYVSVFEGSQEARPLVVGCHLETGFR